MSSRTPPEGLGLARLFMVFSSISPLFIFWAIRGNKLIPDLYFIAFCAFMVIAPNAFLWLRISIAKKLAEKRTLTIGVSEDHRDHLLVYLFAMLLPFYATDFGTWRDLAATLTALAFIVFLFWHLNLHYMNIIFAAFKYRVFTIYAPADGNVFTGKSGLVLITRRVTTAPNEKIVAYRVSDSVYLEI
jgi:hypothetical protein